MPKKETFTSRFEETRGGRVPKKSKIWGDVFYGWSLTFYTFQRAWTYNGFATNQIADKIRIISLQIDGCILELVFGQTLDI